MEEGKHKFCVDDINPDDYPKVSGGVTDTIINGPNYPEDCQDVCGMCNDGASPAVNVTVSWTDSDRCKKLFGVIWSNGQNRDVCPSNHSRRRHCLVNRSTEPTQGGGVQKITTVSPAFSFWRFMGGSSGSLLSFKRYSGVAFSRSRIIKNEITLFDNCSNPEGDHTALDKCQISQGSGYATNKITDPADCAACSYSISGASGVHCVVGSCDMHIPDNNDYHIITSGSVTGTNGVTVAWGGVI